MIRHLMLLIALLALPALHAESIWVEGEAADTSSCKPHPWWYDKVKTDALSGGKWQSNWADKAGVATYSITTATEGNYTLWLRANPVQSTMSYRVDGGDWQQIDWDKDQRGRMNIAADNKPDLRFIAWCKVAVLPLTAGKHSLEFRFHSGNNNHGAIDCFCLDNTGWIPSGIQKPGRQVAAKPGDWFPVVADLDAFSDESLTDVSALVKAPAGQDGFLQADGDDLRFADATAPVKFWGVGSNLGSTRTPEEMTQRARWYRKNGINMVRQHTVIGDVGLLRADGTFDPARLDLYDRWFAELKKQGIYTTWSVLYPHHGAFVRNGDVDAATMAALRSSMKDGADRDTIVSNDWLNLDRGLQDYALRYFATLLEHRNPYTKLRYRDDPALAILEMQNESNIFFHTINSIWEGKPDRFARQLQRGLHTYARETYGDQAGVAKAWGGNWLPADDWQAGVLAVAAPFHWGPDGPMYQLADQHRRVGDTIAYLTTVQRAYYTRRRQELRDLGFQGVIVTTAWKGVGASSLANLYCDTVGDMIDRHNYFGGGDGGHRIVEGKVSIDSHLGQPGRGLLSMGLFQVADRPFAVSEWSMTPPSPWKAEAAPLMAFYGMGLQGWDSSAHFATGDQRLGDGWPGLGKYVSATPHYMGQFPALATAIHRGHIREGAAIASRQVSAAQMYSGRDELGQSLGQGDHDYKALGDKVATPPEFLALGRVTVAFGEGEGSIRDPGKRWNQQERVLRAAGDELVWDYGRRVVEVRSPRTQAIIGFAGGRRIALPDLEVAMETPFASLIFTAMDDRPLASSRLILVTAQARDKQTGSVYNDDWSVLRTVGAPPLLMEPVQASIRLTGDRPAQVQALDIYGVPMAGELPLAADGSFHIDGRYRTYYYAIRR